MLTPARARTNSLLFKLPPTWMNYIVNLVPTGVCAVLGALRRKDELIFDLVAKLRIHGGSPAQGSFLGNAVKLGHLIDKGVFPGKIMRNAARLHALIADDTGRPTDGHRIGR